MSRLLAVALLLAGCTSAQLQTTDDILDILAPTPPTPRQACEQHGGTWQRTEHYDPSTGRWLGTDELCLVR